MNTSEIDLNVINSYNDMIQISTDKQATLKQFILNTNHATADLIKSSKGTVLSQKEIQIALHKTTAKAKLTTLGLNALSTAGNALASMGIMLAIQGIIMGIDYFAHAEERAKEAFANLKQECETLETDLSSVEDNLKNVSDRINELKSKGTLTLTEQEEYDKLVKESNELERQNELLEEQLRIKNKDKNDTFVSMMDKEAKGDVPLVDENGNQIVLTGADYLEHWDNFDIENYKSAKSRGDKDTADDYEQKMMERYNEYAELAKGISYIPEPSTEDEKKVNEWLDFVNDYQDRMLIALGNDNAKTNAFNRIVDNWQFDDVVQGLQDLGKEGKVTAKMLKNPAYSEFVQKLIDIGVISNDTDSNLKIIANAFNGVTTSAQEYVDSLDTEEALSSFIKNIDNEAKALGKTKDEMTNLVGQHILLNNSNLDLNSQIEQIKLLGATAKWSDEKIKDVIELMNRASGNLPSSMTQHEKDMRSNSAELTLHSLFGGWKQVDTSDTDDEPPTTYTPSNNTSAKEEYFDDSYHTELSACIEQDSKDIEKFEKEREALNRQFENALDTGNKEQVEILRKKLGENAEAQKTLLHKQNEANRITQGNLLQNLYQYAPELAGKAWEEISEVELTRIENALSKKAETAEDSAKNQASYNLNQYKGIVEDLKAISNAITENSDSWWQSDEDIKGHWQSLIDFQDEYSNEWIEKQKAFDNLTAKEEISAYERMINNNKAFCEQILADTSLSYESKVALIKECNDKIEEIEKNLYDTVKQKLTDSLNSESSKLGSLQTLLQSYYDVTNSVAEAQHEINKELSASKAMYEYLDEDSRKLLFNQEDYNALNEELIEIQAKADKLQRSYEKDIRKATADNLEEITSQYEMQYETLMKSYEIAKADLEVAKKKQQLNNVLKERNVRMFIDGQWQWVANTQDVINAQSELADAEYARNTAAATLKQTNSLNELTARQDSLATVINKIENGTIDLKHALDKITESFGYVPSAVKNLFSKLQTISSGNSSTSQKKQSAKSTSSVNSSDYASWATAQMAANSKAWHTASAEGKQALHNANLILGKKLGMSYNSSSGTWAYADGSDYTKSGLALMGENGFEAFINANGHLIPISQPTVTSIASGGIVFNQEQMNNLRSLWDLSNSGKSTLSGINNPAPQHNIDNSNCNNVIINGLTVDSGSTDGQVLISALRRYVGNH